MKERFDDLYRIMATSDNVAYMRTFGNVHRKMMNDMIAYKPELAQDYLDQLESIRWNNYLTPKEAEKVVNAMVPKAPWSRETWRQAMEPFGYATEDEPCYNSCSLWAVMNMVYSDSANTIANIIGQPLADIPNEKLVGAVHALALDKLKDKDGRFNVRTYFGL